MKNSMNPLEFDTLFSPRRIAVFGSVKEGKIASQIFTQMTRGGFSGDLYSVNPSAEVPKGIEGISSFSTAAEIPAEVDLAVLSVPARFTAGTLTDCGKKGIPFAVILTSGFTETGNSEGEAELKKIVAEYGIRIIGPNCAGIMSTPSKMFASIEKRMLPGKTALISQSGAVGAAVIAMADMAGIGFSHFASIGNRTDIDESDLLNFLADDPATTSAALYLESVIDGRKFLNAASRFTNKKPLILIKAGKSDTGMRAASSHTGSMAGSDSVFEAACVQAGIIRVEGIEEMLDLCTFIEHYPLPAGKNLLIVTNSGGPGILTSDMADKSGLKMPVPGDRLKEKLEAVLLPNASLNNPVDLTVEGTEEDYAKAVEEGLSAGYDAAIAINVGTPFLDSTGLAEGIIKGAAKVPGKPVLPVFMAGDIVKTGENTLKKAGFFPFKTGERAVAALAAVLSSTTGKPEGEKDWSIKADSSGPSGDFLEPDQVKFLEDKGFPFSNNFFITTEDEAASCSEKLSFPVVMKVVSPEIIHKSDVGGVILNIMNKDELIKNFTDMKEKFSNYDFRGAMVYHQVPAGKEFILGAKRDPDFGPVILTGAGGVMSELIEDVTLRIAPLTKAECETMLGELKTGKLIEGFRGEAPLAKDKFIDLMIRLSELMVTEPWITELDFNPVFLYEKDITIADVRIIR